jgi:hypothetical protein
MLVREHILRTTVLGHGSHQASDLTTRAFMHIQSKETWLPSAGTTSMTCHRPVGAGPR